MSYLKNNCSSTGFDLVGVSSSLAIFISNSFGTDDLAIIAAFLSCLGDNIALIGASKSACEPKK